MRIVLALLPALFLLACNAAPPPADNSASLQAAAQRYEDAQIAGDAAALQQLIADDYVLVGSDGARSHKAELIAFWTADGFDPAPVTVREPIEHIWSDGAALGGMVTLSWTADGAPVNVTLRYVDVWALRDGKWRVVYGQSTRVPAP
jgi:ketosteroid isomerase-like protein